MLFRSIISSVGVTNTTNLTTLGKFIVEIEGLYLIAANIMSHTPSGEIGFYVNGKRIARTYIGADSSWETGSGNVIVELHRDSNIWIQSINSNMKVYSHQRSCLTIVRIS